MSKEKEIREHAIKFAEYVNDDIVYDNFVFMSEEMQNRIYQQFLKDKLNQTDE